MNSRICMVCYDVSNDKTRRKLAKLVSEYGKRVQGSVFLCDIDAERVRELEARLRAFHMNNRKAPRGKRAASDKVVPIKKRAARNTLKILMIPLTASQVGGALSLGATLDCDKQYAVI